LLRLVVRKIHPANERIFRGLRRRLEDEPPVTVVAEEIPLRAPILEIERVAATRNQSKTNGWGDWGEKPLF
jgi:hypothetical protein